MLQSGDGRGGFAAALCSASKDENAGVRSAHLMVAVVRCLGGVFRLSGEVFVFAFMMQVKLSAD